MEINKKEDWAKKESFKEWGCDIEEVIKTIMKSKSPQSICEDLFVQILCLMELDYYQRWSILESTKNRLKKLN